MSSTRIFIPKGTNSEQVAEWVGVTYNFSVPSPGDRRYTVSAPGLSDPTGELTVTYCKDADIPGLVIALRGIGVVGSDIYSELDEIEISRLRQHVIGPITNDKGQRLRYGVFCLKSAKATVTSKLERGEPIQVGTSYPKYTSTVLPAGVITRVIRGGAEALPGLFARGEVPDDQVIEAIVEVVQTGGTGAANDLTELDIAATKRVQKPVDLLEIRATIGPVVPRKPSWGIH